MNSTFGMLKDRFAEFDALFRAREFRERVMLGCMAAAAVFFSIDTLFVQPIAAERAQVALNSERTSDAVLRNQAELKQLTNVELTDEERREQAEIEQLKRQIAEIDAQMGSEIAELIPPQAIVSVLEELLDGDRELKLIRLETKAPERIGHDQEAILAGAHAGLYRHGLQIEIEGSFNATVDYLERLEGSRWNLLWDRLEYSVQQYPTATVTIDLHTLSELEEWIGV